ncbi:alkylation response protein AidB-like acyl-CoA dehydrogenase [Bacillus ectoiniformans]|uniref:acyl-CoA dehydrogenase family protein n=1 Tax=Bacillus ectoiniformans TaxID=1494429 RepID=UPI00195A4B00|nr:acyl-CoA dehydrogenase family protein [Bacillus ectoiniformans]MBM7648095.1 alkylation response protein AidB-like acyl-CoA dehydrogenase [Bacillus ectoiniformans]
MNFYQEDHQLQSLLKEMLDPAFFEYADQELTRFGEKCAHEIEERARFTDREGQPRLIKYDAYGEDISEVWVNEGYKKTVEETYNTGIVGYVHKEIPHLKRKGNYIYSYAQGYILSHSEAGFYCPVTLSMATAYLLDQYGDEEVRKRFLPHVLSTGEVPHYEGATFLTERQGGSDVGANETKAVLSGDHYQLYGEKYFASNAGMCGVAMVLARIEGAPAGTKGLTLFAVPWKREDGSLNGIRIRRLKDKLGVRAVPSAEVEFDGAAAYVVGDASKGFYYMMEALNLSRVCNAVASLGIMKRAYLEAKQYAENRVTFGRKLMDFPMVKSTLTRLCAKQEIELRTVFTFLPLFERVMNDHDRVTKEEEALNRLYIALLKKETAEQAIHFAHEAIEMHGGNGFIEDFVTPRLLRDAQVLTVWEGTANILGLEVLRLMQKFQVHELFMQAMRSRLDSILSTPEKALVKKGIEQLQNLIQSVSQASSDHQTYHSKEIARQMTKILESVTALEYAAEDSSRAEKIMKVLIEEHWADSGVFNKNMSSVEYFDEIVMNSTSEVKVQQ